LMSGKLKMVDKMKSDFFSSMSHELRTPLTSIKEGISLLQDGVGGTVTEKQKRLLAILSEESKRLINLVNSLLDLSKMEAGMMTYTFEQESLAPLIGRATTEMIPLVETKKITLETKIDEKLPTIKMDRERILQVLRNLIGNGVKFTPKGGQVRVSARLKNREVESRCQIQSWYHKRKSHHHLPEISSGSPQEFGLHQGHWIGFGYCQTCYHRSWR